MTAAATVAIMVSAAFILALLLYTVQSVLAARRCYLDTLNRPVDEDGNPLDEDGSRMIPLVDPNNWLLRLVTRPRPAPALILDNAPATTINRVAAAVVSNDGAVRAEAARGVTEIEAFLRRHPENPA